MAKVRYSYKKLSIADIKAIDKMLEAAGEVRVTRAMMNTCKPKYTNDGWNNCWFTQMFGGAANLKRMTEAYVRRQQGAGVDMNVDAFHVEAIADKLKIKPKVVGDIINLFDSGTVYGYKQVPYTWTDWQGNEVNDTETRPDENVVKVGKVATFLEYVAKWLRARGINTPTTSDISEVHAVVIRH